MRLPVEPAPPPRLAALAPSSLLVRVMLWGDEAPPCDHQIKSSRVESRLWRYTVYGGYFLNHMSDRM